MFKGDTAMPVDVNKLCHELYNSEKNIKGIIKKDIVPVIGCTGAGKSTLINFLQGRDLTKKKKGAKVSVFAPDAPGYPSIGESALASETAYPGGYEVKDKDYLLCDTAGYLDTHSAEKSLSIPYANFLATQYADTVKGVIILINFPSLFYNRADNFKKLSEIINTTFKNGAKDKVFSD